MRKIPLNPLRLLAALQRRFTRSRPGSVLIMVVALLVLMALIGTAYISTAQYDRGSSQQHEYNTQIDLLVQSVIEMAKGQILRDIIDPNGVIANPAAPSNPIPNTYRPGNDTAYTHYDGVGFDQSLTDLLNQQTATLPPSHTNPGTPFLADRFPSTTSIFANASATNAPFWRFITQSPVNGGEFESPWSLTNQPQTYSKRYRFAALPSIIPALPGTGIVLNGTTYPTWLVRAPNGTVTARYLAADADGDGIPDAGLFRLPIGTINGITYYGAIRTIDNAAAINASVASVWFPFNVGGNLATPPFVPGELYPTNVYMSDFLHPTDRNAQRGAVLDSYRGFSESRNPVVAWADADPTRIGSQPYQRTDYAFQTPFEAAWFQLGRRLDNPGPAPTNQPPYRALPLSEQVALAYRFCLGNQQLLTRPGSAQVPAVGAGSLLEQIFPWSTVKIAPLQPYASDDVFRWYNQSFNFGGMTPVSARAALVTRNPVSNFIPTKFTPRLAPPFVIGDSYTVSLPGTVPGSTVPATFVCIQPTSVVPAATNLIAAPFNDPTWVHMPWTSAPTKISANAGTFGQLYLAFWSTFCEQPPISGNAVNTVPIQPIGGTPAAPGDYRMFRSPIRGTASAATTPPPGPTPAPAVPGFRLDPYQVLLLRSALAAVNTLDMRDSDDDITSRTIQIPPAPLCPFWLKTTVYGNEKQPYITEVYANNATSPTNGYIAIELYNPYPTPIEMRNWVLATIDRSATTPPGQPPQLRLVPVASTQQVGTGWKDATPNQPLMVGSPVPIIEPFHRIVIANSPTPPPALAGVVPPSVTTADPPPVGQARLYVVPDLGGPEVFNHELVILRPRSAKGVLSKSSDPGNTYDETNPANLADLVPVDSYDFTGLPYPDATTPAGLEWHYIRPNPDTTDTARISWHFVWPGRYSLNPPATAIGPGPGTPPPAGIGPTPPFYEGTAHGITGSTIVAGGLASLGSPDPAPALPTYKPVTLQMNSQDFGGPNKVTGAQAWFPFGGFARNGDLMEIPFIGSYRIIAYSPTAPPPPVTTTFTELNSAPLDSAFADDGDVVDDNDSSTTPRQLENIGHFCPIDGFDVPGSAAPNPLLADDFVAAGTNGAPSVKWRYHFATRLFDYLTVQSPQDDYLPDVDPAATDPATYSGPTPLPYKYPAASGNPNNQPTPIGNSIPRIRNYLRINLNGSTEETAPVNGLVNINTASWRVLGAVPWMGNNPAVAPFAGVSALQMNVLIGISIATYRDVQDGPARPQPHGPFRNIFELNRVPILQANGTYATGTGGKPILFRDLMGDISGMKPFTPQQGVISPLARTSTATGTLAPPAGDFQSRYVMMTRASNLITTRSDSFTVYVLVQGWRNAGTPNPQLVVQRRAAFIADRSGVTPNNKSLTVTNIPTE